MLVISVGVRVGARPFEVFIVRDTADGASIGTGAILTGAARGTVGGVRVDEAIALAADDGAGCVFSLEFGRAWR